VDITTVIVDLQGEAVDHESVDAAIVAAALEAMAIAPMPILALGVAVHRTLVAEHIQQRLRTPSVTDTRLDIRDHGMAATTHPHVCVTSTP